jgi:hypothetical protein
MAAMFLPEVVKGIGNFPKNKLLLLTHLLLSHHGQPQFGSPQTPKILEAIVLHQLDDLDAKLNGIGTFIREELSATGRDPGWTSFNSLMASYFYAPPDFALWGEEEAAYLADSAKSEKSVKSENPVNSENPVKSTNPVKSVDLVEPAGSDKWPPSDFGGDEKGEAGRFGENLFGSPPWDDPRLAGLGHIAGESPSPEFLTPQNAPAPEIAKNNRPEAPKNSGPKEPWPDPDKLF